MSRVHRSSHPPGMTSAPARVAVWASVGSGGEDKVHQLQAGGLGVRVGEEDYPQARRACRDRHGSAAEGCPVDDDAVGCRVDADNGSPA